MRDGKKILIWLLAGSFCLPVGVTGVSAWKVQAEETGDSIITNDVLEMDGWNYKYEGTDENPTVTIVEYTGESADVVIPAVIDGYPVTCIQESIFRGSSIETVEMPKSLLDIGDAAFCGCEKLRTVTVADDGEAATPAEEVEYMIGVDAFADCTSLTSVELPQGITRIGERAFNNCSNLQNVEIPDGVTQIDSGAFRECTSLTEVELPDTVEIMQSSAFNSCSSLTSVVLSHKLTLIDAYTFSNCVALKSIIIPDGVTEIDFAAFEYCTDLEVAVIPESVQNIEFDSFYSCSNLTIYAQKDSVAMAFADNVNRHVNGIPVKSATVAVSENAAGWMYMEQENEVEVVGYTGNLADITVPDMINGKPVTSVAGRIFKEKAITSVVLPDSVVSIGDDIFHACTALERVTLSSNLKTIGDSAFKGCTALENITFPSDITYVGNYAFEGCTKLTSAVFKERSENTGEIVIGYNAFKDCDLQSMVVPDGVKDILDETFHGNANMTSIILPEGIEHIGIYAFAGCSNLKTIKIPSSVTYIWEWAFYLCSSLEEIEIPAQVTNIEHHAFYNCLALKKATILSNVKKIGNNAFSGCEELTIYTNAGAVAETYAKKNEIPVVIIGGVESNTGKQDNNYVQGDNPVAPPTTEVIKDDSTKKVTIPTVAKVKKFKATAKKKSLVLSWKKVSGASGYQIQVSTKKNFKGAKIKSVKKSKTKYTVSKLKSKKKYYARIRAYKTYKDATGKSQKVYGKWVQINKKTK